MKGTSLVGPCTTQSKDSQGVKPGKGRSNLPPVSFHAMEFVEFIKTPKVDNVTLRRAFHKSVDGTLCITGHHLILSSRKDNNEELWLLHTRVDTVEKKLSGNVGSIILKCKDFQIIKLDIPSVEECLNIATSIEKLSNINNITLQYPFFYRPLFDVLEDGWSAFLPESEFSRLLGHCEYFRLSHINKNFEVCPSYPQAVVVPKAIDDESLIKIAQFRQHGRFPVLSYYHNENKMVMMRSSQPMPGPNWKRCKEDEKLVNAVLGMGKRGYIIDTRSLATAKVAQNKGGGYESEAHYSQWRRIHQPVERHTVLHESLIKLLEACSDKAAGVEKWLSKLESSNWLSHVKDVITCACVVAQCVDKDSASVLVHGSDGTDSTLQVCSLAQIVLDADCRTVRGFEALVEREWLQAGHPFADRCAKSAFAISKHRQEAPVFLLFLDCVWQIWQQFPCSFEFNEDFLVLLFQHAYSSQFGTFLCNNDLERRNLKLASTTVSLWSYINKPEILERYLNPLYEPNPSVIWPSVAPQSLLLWSSLFQRDQLDQSPKKEAWEEIVRIKETDKELRCKVVRLRRQLAALEKEAIQRNLIKPVAFDPLNVQAVNANPE
ncbi:unnamed protein product [Owenia fusiformis]|uniref:Myotubularin phosphatase domain-containing protein n=1 Tax=Owenia fusiformis TaxID=6347 RepID=A0A8S4N6Q1_OWEFU|nr:unnamed protein product [Owenia fusiformis]